MMPEVDLDAISEIESEGTANAVGDGGLALGMYQIHAPVVVEFNQFKKANLRHSDMYDPDTARKVAEWYLTKRIPQMLIYFKQPVTIENILASYNAGIGRVVKGQIPASTKKYIETYLKIQAEKEK